MSQPNYTIRTMTRPELDIAVEWAAIEGWNPGLHDADCYFAADPTGFLMGFVDEEPMASISVVRYGSGFGFLGFYIVKPEYRGQGYGLKLWNAGLEYLKGCTVGLDGVVAQQDNYKKSGFALAFRNARYQGSGGEEMPVSKEIVELSTVPFATLAAYEQPFFPADRSKFLQAWIVQPESHALGIMHNGSLSGYAVMRACRSGHKIGPLYADSPELADTLFTALRAKANPGEPIFLDVSELNPAAVELAKRHGMSVVFETARMYTGPAPKLPLDRIFGITSFEIG